MRSGEHWPVYLCVGWSGTVWPSGMSALHLLSMSGLLSVAASVCVYTQVALCSWMLSVSESGLCVCVYVCVDIRPAISPLWWSCVTLIETLQMTFSHIRRGTRLS